MNGIKHRLMIVATIAVAIFMSISFVYSAQTDLTNFAGSESSYSVGDTLRVGVVAKTDTIYAYRADKISVALTVATLTDTLIVNFEQGNDGIHFADSRTDTLTATGTYEYTITDVDAYPYLVTNLSQAGADSADIAPLKYRVNRKLMY